MTDVTSVPIETLAEEMYRLVAHCAGKRNLKPGDLAKELIAKHGAACSKDDCKKALRILTDSGRCVYRDVYKRQILMSPPLFLGKSTSRCSAARHRADVVMATMFGRFESQSELSKGDA